LLNGKKLSRNYKFHNPEGVYFISFAVVKWLDVFTRKEYAQIIIDSLHYCQKEKGMEVFAWCIMTTHVHLIFRIVNKLLPELVIGDFKRYTSKKIIKEITENTRESRRDFLLACFKETASKSSNVVGYQFWQHDNHPIELWSPKVTQEKIHYIHNNPVEAGLVYKPEDYVFSSARDYCDGKGLVKDVIVIK
jgi:REP element-mobilizing transposase RayT